MAKTGLLVRFERWVIDVLTTRERNRMPAPRLELPTVTPSPPKLPPQIVRRRAGTDNDRRDPPRPSVLSSEQAARLMEARKQNPYFEEPAPAKTATMIAFPVLMSSVSPFERSGVVADRGLPEVKVSTEEFASVTVEKRRGDGDCSWAIATSEPAITERQYEPPEATQCSAPEPAPSASRQEHRNE